MHIYLHIYITKMIIQAENIVKSTFSAFCFFVTVKVGNLTVECMMDIQKLSVDYFLFINDWMLTAYYSKLFASLYESNNLYKQANSMYKLALQIRNENIQGENEK